MSGLPLNKQSNPASEYGRRTGGVPPLPCTAADIFRAEFNDALVKYMDKA